MEQEFLRHMCRQRKSQKREEQMEMQERRNNEWSKV